MSYERAKTFPEDSDILGDNFEAEFDNIAEAFANLFQAAKTSASEALTLTTSFADVPGASASITAPQASLAIVMIDVSTTTGDVSGTQVALNVDGSDKEPPVGSESAQYVISLASGAHTLKLRAKRTLEGSYKLSASTSFTYLLIPDPS